jgi:hypothetical protein
VSDSDKDSIKWFSEKYPLENYLSDEIGRQVNEIFKHIHPKNKQYQIPLDMYVMKNEEGIISLAARDVSKIFYGSLARTIIDIITKNLESNMSQKLNQMIDEKAKDAVKGYMNRATPMIILQDFKRCPFCGLDNDYSHKHCTECGGNLEK